MGQQWTGTGTGALGAADLGMAQALSEEVATNPTIELPEFTQDWGNRLFIPWFETRGPALVCK